jgi:hypothetical protein
MGIPDPTIDPITGLPILDTSPIVQQIPLGRQTVDYAGWNATAQPTRTPLYPDDVIPVFANVQGQHPQTGNAQNVGTDGHGRLLVSGLSGGSSPAHPPMTTFNTDGYSTSHGDNTMGSDPLTQDAWFCGYSVSLSVANPQAALGSDATIRFQLFLEGTDNGGRFYYDTLSLPGGPSCTVNSMTTSAHIMFPASVDINAAIGPDTQVEYHFICNATLAYSVTLYFASV